MSDLPHLRIEGTETASSYVYAGPTPQGVVFNLPPRNKPVHARKLKGELAGAGAEAERRRAEKAAAHPELVERQPEGVVLTFRSDPGHELKLEGLERRRSGIELLGVTETDGIQVARVFVPTDKLIEFLRLVDRYAVSVVLTLTAPAANEAALKALEDPKADIRFRGPVYRLKDGSIKVKFVVPEVEATNFQNRVGGLATLFGTSRQNDKLIESIGSVRLALIEDFWQDTLAFPPADREMWWEIWLRGSRANAVDVHSRFVELARIVGVPRVSDRHVAFPERVVVHAFATAKQLSESIDLLAMLAELRQAKELASHYVELPPRDQRQVADDAIGRLVLPGGDAPSVCILDSGIHQTHPLIRPGLAVADMHAVDQAWDVSDHDPRQHGTGMAGVALYECLTKVFGSTGAVNLRHILESVKILPPPPAVNNPPDYGRVMQDGVLKAHIQAPRRNRAICMAVTADDRDMGLPSLWSGAVDDLCAGVLDDAPKLMFISAGNVDPADFAKPQYAYHQWNITRAAVEDPAQAWNALTVGAMTDKVRIEDPSLNGWHPIAEAGDLCPTSRTSLPWPAENQGGWPLKPDIVMEGGNYAERGRDRAPADDLSLLTTILHPSGRLLETTRDTSPATAAAARMAAVIWSRYPRLRPETVRALLVHSASWTRMMRERFSGNQKAVIQQRLRCYGYGVPNLTRALNSAENAVTLIYEGQLQPFCKEGSTYKTYEMHLHDIPWPSQVLEDLGAAQVAMRVTLSYFIEPSPNRIGWGTTHRYQSHGLRFDVIRPPGETLKEFKQRMSKAEWDDPKQRPRSAKETRNWVIGEGGRTHGSLHSDWWIG